VASKAAKCRSICALSSAAPGSGELTQRGG
jgi:hypothetical protein